jgi:hypothetical protein
MQKLQIREEIMAVAALLALGMLTVLAGGLNAKVTTAAEPKASFGACMALMYATGPVTSRDIATCVLVGAFGGPAIDDAISRIRGERSFSVSLGTRVLTALRLARYASPLAGGLFGLGIIVA